MTRKERMKFIERIGRTAMSVLLSLVLVVGMCPVLAMPAWAEGEHNHSGWTEWNTTTALPTEAGSYYLTADVTLSGTWNVPSGTTNLCLNGYTVLADTSDSNRFNVITIDEGATLNLYDEHTGNSAGKITGGCSGKGGGVYVTDGSTFNMYGGEISGNTGKKVDNYANDGCGGGVRVAKASTFNLYGGSIKNNTAGDNSGGGVSVHEHGDDGGNTFTMYGGEISGNTAYQGAGVYNSNTFNMYGGKITGNRAVSWGGGVCSSSSPFKIHGNPQITGNVEGNTVTSNVKLGYSDIISVDGELTEGASIGVLKYSVTGTFTSGYSTYNDGTDPSAYFTSDADACGVLSNNGEAMLALPPVYYIDHDTDGTVKDSTPVIDYTILSDSTRTWGSGQEPKWYVATTDTAINNDIHLSGNSTVNLILCDGATLTASSGINMNGSTLNIYAGSTDETVEGTGKLIVTGRSASEDYDENSAGVGGAIVLDYEELYAAGTVNIHGGIVKATGGSNSAGIGGTHSGEGAAVTVYGGTVKAIGSENGKGIGGGNTANSNGSLTLGTGMYLYGGDSENPEENPSNYVPLEGGDYARSRYMTVSNVSPHNHNFTSYSASGATITAICIAEDCTLANNTATLTIEAPASGGSAAVLKGDVAALGASEANIKYYTRRGSGWTGETASAPDGTGFYKAAVTLNGATAEVVYGVNTISKDANFDSNAAHGDFTVPAVAAVGAAVIITAEPGAGYDLGGLIVTKESGGMIAAAVSGSSGSFIMPDESVTVSATFVPRSIPVGLAVTRSDNAPGTCTAKLLNENFTEVSGQLTKKANESFIMSVSADDGYDYTVTFDPSNEVKNYITEFTADEYNEYIAYARSQDIPVSAQTELFRVTMPAVNQGQLNIVVTFAKTKTFTILYQPASGSPGEVWCKFTNTENASDTNYITKMNYDAAMGDNNVWSVKVAAAFNPSKVAFAASRDGAESESLVAANVSQTASWNDIEGGKYLIIGGNAKTVVAAFVADASTLPVYDSEEVSFSGGNGSGVTYQIAVCATDENGVVTGSGAVKAPAAPPAPTGYSFAGWRGFEGTAPNQTERIYAAGSTIQVRGNSTFNAVWKINTLSISLDRNGGSGGSDITSIDYGQKLTIAENPVKSGLAFDGWAVGKDVTEGLNENIESFVKGALFDFNKEIINNLDLKARWKHVHSYSCYQLDDPVFDGILADYYKYKKSVHVRMCGCLDLSTEAHSFNSSGVCECGYRKELPATVNLDISYGEWNGTTYTHRMYGFPQTAGRNTEVTVDAPSKLGNLQFSKWQYSTNGTKWHDLAAAEMVGFIIPCNMEVRALYVNPVNKPKITLSAERYENAGTIDVGGAQMPLASVLYHMNYKLPDGYTFLDAGVRLGDNAGISYYELKERKRSAGERALWGGINFATNVLSGGIGEALVAGATEAASLENVFYYEKRENSVLDEISAATLGENMFLQKPIVADIPPIYWQSNTKTGGRSGSLNVLAPVNFIQKNNGKHWIYGIAYLQYKTTDGTVKTIYTDALATTLDDIPANTVSREGQ